MSKRAKIPTRTRITTYLEGFTTTHGYLPSLRDVTMGLSLGSPDAARYHLRILRDEGRIIWDGRAWTTIRWVRELPVGDMRGSE